MALLLLTALPGEAQLINVQSPLHNLGDSSFNRTGVSFGLSFGGGNRIRGFNAAGQITPNVMISQGSAGTALPPFGGYDPNADLRSGFALVGGDIGFSLGLVAGKGNTRSIVSTSPSVTMFNGQSASIFSGEARPFVTSITPVIGNSTGVGMVPSLGLPEGFQVSRYPERPINSRPRSTGNGTSTAARGALSLAEIERHKAREELRERTELLAEIDSLVARARELVGEEQYGAARVKYSRALRIMAESAETTELRAEIAGEYEQIRNKR